jgi:hypothetical protein
MKMEEMMIERDARNLSRKETPYSILRRCYREIVDDASFGLKKCFEAIGQGLELGKPKIFTTVLSTPTTRLDKTQPDLDGVKHVEIHTMSQVPFRIRKMTFWGVPASDLTVVDLKVGKNSQLCCGNPVSGEFFENNEIRIETAQISQRVSVMLQVRGNHEEIRIEYLGDYF